MINLKIASQDDVQDYARLLFNEYREKRFAPPPLLRRMVMAGMFGRKSGKGFYDYTDPKNPRANALLQSAA